MRGRGRGARQCRMTKACEPGAAESRERSRPGQPRPRPAPFPTRAQARADLQGARGAVGRFDQPQALRRDLFTRAFAAVVLHAVRGLWFCIIKTERGRESWMGSLSSEAAPRQARGPGGKWGSGRGGRRGRGAGAPARGPRGRRLGAAAARPARAPKKWHLTFVGGGPALAAAVTQTRRPAQIHWCTHTIEIGTERPRGRARQGLPLRGLCQQCAAMGRVNSVAAAGKVRAGGTRAGRARRPARREGNVRERGPARLCAARPRPVPARAV